MITEQEMEEPTGQLARRAVTLFPIFHQERIDTIQDMVKAILKDYIIIKKDINGTNTTKS